MRNKVRKLEAGLPRAIDNNASRKHLLSLVRKKDGPWHLIIGTQTNRLHVIDPDGITGIFPKSYFDEEIKIERISLSPFLTEPQKMQFEKLASSPQIRLARPFVARPKNKKYQPPSGLQKFRNKGYWREMHWRQWYAIRKRD